MRTGELIKILADYCPDTIISVTSPEFDGILTDSLVIGAVEYDEMNTLELQCVPER